MSYGQNPYGQNPYGGQPQQNPYGQRPPGSQPQQNPYGQPQQNPYGQPGQGRPQDQPNPYGQPQQNPYAPPGQGGQNPYARPPGQPYPYAQPGQGQNPYAQPAPGQQSQNPYAQQADAAEAWRQSQPPAAPEAAVVTETLTVAEHAVPVHTLPDDPESFVTRSLGEVIGVALRPRSNDVAALTRCRQAAVSRMADMAKAANADAVIGLHFDSNADEVVAYGTAVLLSDDLDAALVDDSAEDEADDSARTHGVLHGGSTVAAGEEPSRSESADHGESYDERTRIGASSGVHPATFDAEEDDSAKYLDHPEHQSASQPSANPQHPGQGQGPGQGWPFSS